MIHSRTPRIVIVGGGFGGLESAFYLRQRMGDAVEIELVSNRDSFFYKPDAIHIPFGLDPDRLRVPIGPAAKRRGIHFLRGTLVDVDTEHQTIRVGDRIVGFDRLILATGEMAGPRAVPGMDAAAISIGSPAGMSELHDRLGHLLEDARRGVRRAVVFLVPRDRAWSNPLYEMCWILDTWLRRQRVREHVDLKLITHEDSFVATFGPRMHERARAEFDRRGIGALPNFELAGIEPGRVVSARGGWTPFDLLVSFPAGVGAARFPALPTDARGFLRTDPESRRVEGHANIYAVGDASDFPVRQGYLAASQADAAAEHIAAGLLGEEPRLVFEPRAVGFLDQLDGATYAQVPLRFASEGRGDAVEVDAQSTEYVIGDSPFGRAGRVAMRSLLPRRFRAGLPVHTGLTGAALGAARTIVARTAAE